MRPPAKKPAGEPAPAMAPGTDPLARGGILDLPPADPVTALRVVGEDPELPLPLSDDKRSFTLGSAERPAVDLSLRHCPHVSGVHVVIHRRGNRLWIVDQESTNGTFFGERREKAGEIAAGGKFRVADKELLALDDGMRVARPTLQWCLGFDAHALVDEVLEVAARGIPVLILGEAGCEQAVLAHAIHQASARRHQRFLAVEPDQRDQAVRLEVASKGTVFLDLAQPGKVTAPFVKELFSSRLHLRPIVAAPRHEAVEQALGRPHARRLYQIDVPRLADRGLDVPRIINRLFAEAKSQLSVNDLGAERVQALTRYAWPGNFDDVRRIAPKLQALLEGGTVTAAAKLLDIRRQSLAETLDRLGFPKAER